MNMSGRAARRTSRCHVIRLGSVASRPADQPLVGYRPCRRVCRVWPEEGHHTTRGSSGELDRTQVISTPHCVRISIAAQSASSLVRLGSCSSAFEINPRSPHMKETVRSHRVQDVGTDQGWCGCPAARLRPPFGIANEPFPLWHGWPLVSWVDSRCQSLLFGDAREERCKQITLLRAQ
jgi:hypothetical protein